jgi:hypothetical protein
MYFLLESLFVGIYTALIFLFVSFSPIENIYLRLFSIGFVKHFLGHYLSLDTYYCNYGDACVSHKSFSNNNDFHESRVGKKKSVTTTVNLVLESIGEGVLFLILGSILLTVLRNRFLLYFSIGFILHTGFELLGVHKKFCQVRCSLF